ncbi:MAG TPA: hypothetical protein VIT88_05370 [Pyrinomonadaceae bacterium]
MHNCKRTKDALIDLALGELNEAQTESITLGLDECEECRAEQQAIAGTLRVSRQALTPAYGSEEFWSRYHYRLQSKLKAAIVSEPTVVRTSFWNGLKAFAASSVRVPLPAALAALALVCVLSFVALSRGQVHTAMTPVTRVEVQTIHVPVVQEKIVRQVVYKDRKRSRQTPVDYANLSIATAEAKRISNPAAKLNLVGFKPADQVNITIIKGNGEDDK